MESRPIGGYGALLGAFGVLFGGALAGLSHANLLRNQKSAGELALLAVATHKLTRILTLDFVTMPLRAPFVTYEGSAGAGEVEQSSKGTGLQRAIGDLVTCPFCSGPWIASALLAASLVRPRATRFLTTMLALTTASDFLHHAYRRAKKGCD
jgi:hypothetical protein